MEGEGGGQWDAMPAARRKGRLWWSGARDWAGPIHTRMVAVRLCAGGTAAAVRCGLGGGGATVLRVGAAAGASQKKREIRRGGGTMPPAGVSVRPCVHGARALRRGLPARWRVFVPRGTRNGSWTHHPPTPRSAMARILNAPDPAPAGDAQCASTAMSLTLPLP